MKLIRVHAWNLALVALAFVLAAVLYERLPDPVPTHWNGRGHADGFTPKPWGPFLLPLVLLATAALFALIPKLSRRGRGVEPFARVYALLALSIVLFLFLVNAVALLSAAGVPLAVERVIPAGLGVLLIVIGNFMGKVTRNFFVGIRTPWTLASEEVWRRTHRFGGRVLVLAGIVVFVAALTGAAFGVLIGALALGAMVPVVYSYVIHRRLVRR